MLRYGASRRGKKGSRGAGGDLNALRVSRRRAIDLAVELQARSIALSVAASLRRRSVGPGCACSHCRLRRRRDWPRS